jgi:hypothetical protein
VFCKLSLSAHLKKADNPICYCGGVLKFTVSKTESRRWRATAKHIGLSATDVTQSLENRCELREESKRQLDVTCELSPFPKGTTARILKAVIKRLKNLFVRLLLWLHFPFTH